MNDALELNYQTQEGLTINIFNNALWRELINRACRNILDDHIETQVISPWGFEVTEDKRYLSKHLRRFYCYIGIPKAFENVVGEKTVIADKFIKNLLEGLATVKTKMLEEIVVLIEQSQLQLLKPENYQCKENDKLLDVQVRFTDNILDDYAKVIIANLDAIDSEKGETSNYRVNRITRWRLYQLYIMSESLFGHLLAPFTHEEAKMHRSIFILADNMIQVFYSSQEMSKPANPWESYIIDMLIKPRIKLMKAAIVSANPDENITITPCAFHIEDRLNLKISRSCYQDAMLKVRSTYLNFI